MTALPNLYSVNLTAGEMQKPKRWWVATAWLWLVMLLDAIAGIHLAVAFNGAIGPAFLLAQVYGILADAARMVCVGAILQWHRWGWWGVLSIAFISSCMNLAYGVGLFLTLLGLAIPIITFLVLKGGGQSAVWPQLR